MVTWTHVHERLAIEPSASIATRLQDRAGTVHVSIDAETVRGEPRGEALGETTRRPPRRCSRDSAGRRRRRQSTSAWSQS